MLAQSLFVGETIHEREIVLADGSKEKLHFRETASADFANLQAQSLTPAETAAAISRLISASLCTPEGKDAVTVKEAAKLKHGVRVALIVAIAEVNGVGSHVGKVSPPEASNGSGTSLSSQESADEPSRKPSDESSAASS